jgi:hypothetical protein
MRIHIWFLLLFFRWGRIRLVHWSKDHYDLSRLSMAVFSCRDNLNRSPEDEKVGELAVEATFLPSWPRS